MIQLAIVVRLMRPPWRLRMPSSRYSGRASAYLATRIQASSCTLARHLPRGWIGRAATLTVLSPSGVSNTAFSCQYSITRACAGTMSSSSLTLLKKVLLAPAFSSSSSSVSRTWMRGRFSSKPSALVCRLRGFFGSASASASSFSTASILAACAELAQPRQAQLFFQQQEELAQFGDEGLSLFEQRLLFGEFGFLWKASPDRQEDDLFLRESAADRPAGATLEQRDSGGCPTPFSWNKL